MKVKEVLRMLRRDGWLMIRQRGSHRQFHHASKPGTVTVVGKLSKTLHPKILASILRQAGLEEV
jgi:predicted RNA binding protein YcfA (HicA-like mRNA interferase family)